MDLSIFMLRRPSTSATSANDYWPITMLCDVQAARFQNWRLFWQQGKYVEDMVRWFSELYQYEEFCCGCRLQTRRKSQWTKPNDTGIYACNACVSKKGKSADQRRPCLRLVVHEDGSKTIEVMRERGKGDLNNVADAFDYWGTPDA